MLPIILYWKLICVSYNLYGSEKFFKLSDLHFGHQRYETMFYSQNGYKLWKFCYEKALQKAVLSDLLQLIWIWRSFQHINIQHTPKWLDHANFTTQSQTLSISKVSFLFKNLCTSLCRFTVKVEALSPEFLRSQVTGVGHPIVFFPGTFHHGLFTPLWYH